MPRSPSSPAFWRSPLRGPWFTSVLGVVLLGGITVLFVTGLVSYAAYNPNLSPVNDMTPDKGLLGFYLFSWPTNPPWLYRLNQGVHVTLGITLIPVLLAKLWSVVPKLFTLPPVRSLAHGLERISLLLLVGGALFEFTTGVLNVQLDYIFPGSFYPLHFYGAWVFFAAFVVHAVLRVPMALRNLRHLRDEEQGPPTEDELVAPDPDPPTVSRRGALGFVGGGSLVLFATTVGRNFDEPLRETAVLVPHGGPEPGSGPGGFQINKTAEAVGIDMRETSGETWRLVVEGRGRTVRLSRDELLKLPLHSAALPIACVEGWSTSDQWWRGVRLRDLAALVGYEEGTAPDVLVESLQRHGAFRHAALRYNQVRDPRSLLALFANGEDLTPDHGYPARIIVPAAPGVLNTKWVARMTFGEL
ncbi:molybdopterin-dependent oxidoreductase [Streptomyces sp. RLB3-17]|uniref:Molybdopterin-dependent oxidoreductase n=1 Tax=Streptomyces mirabilis TaxID=68239 RepID=A0ABU3UPJ9_9ACTN|nr:MULTISPECIES: molybdopterin-dependent oxidoreductase [Streptomyces]MCX5350697.1 molybdopterin-dependent oxidoreductase [Streptomyces mirabilis]MDU8995846.1 molybdopterin-dependent oxidoreductase [Streptomyces mirabilis]QDN79300.1 molybdopterin-dependent oxidoreductase [Streptomyces sp. S1A1-7]QDN89051.1 molybdopterin-dependent oxidoreductase [Streptomyces sp. RLB3-6]QDN99630.1 molybdopterin-dependent oxidoreductase [Streptomyces sp. RLB1-9]